MAKVFQDPRSPLVAGKRPWKIDYVDMNGRRRRVGTTATTKAEAEAILRANLSEMAKARISGSESVEAVKPKALEDFWNEEYKPHQKATKKHSTYVTDCHRVKPLLRYFGKIKLRAISKGDVRRYMDQRQNETLKRGKKGKKGKRLAPATVNRERELLCAILNEARLRGYIERNPVQDVKKLKENNTRDRWLTDAEEADILEEAPDWLKPIMLLAVETGARRGEVLALRWTDVDRERRLLKLSRTKNGGTRHVPLSASSLAALDSARPHIGEKGPSPFVFVHPETGKPWLGNSVFHAFQRAVERAGLDIEGPNRVVFHTLRHTTVSRLVQADVSERKIREMIGHSSSSMTDRYAHLAPDHLREAVDALEKRRKSAKVVTNPSQRGDVKQASV